MPMRTGSALLQEIASWPIEAKDDDNLRYFYEIDDLKPLLEGRRNFVIGRKGTGKTAIAEHIFKTVDYDRSAIKMSFKNFPFNVLYKLSDADYTSPNQYISAWRMAILISILKMFSKNPMCSPDVRKVIDNVFPNPIDQELRTGFDKFLKRGFGLNVAGSGATLTAATASSSSTATDWNGLLLRLESFAKENAVPGTFYVLFDELDEDYKDILTRPDKGGEYFQLLTSLFKATQDIRFAFQDSVAKIVPVVFLRSDIYDLIRDPDKNKWKDRAIDLNWRPNTLQRLLTYRLSRAINNDGPPLTFRQAWSMVFSQDEMNVGHKQRKAKEIFFYILDNTYLRPRDVISFVRSCAHIADELGLDRADARVVKEADARHSTYSRDEIIDEMQSVVPDVDDLLDLFSQAGKPILTYTELKELIDTHIEEHPRSDNLKPDGLIELFFYFGVIGNIQPSDGRRVFAYHGSHIRLNRNQPLCVHRSLLKSLRL